MPNLNDKIVVACEECRERHFREVLVDSLRLADVGDADGGDVVLLLEDFTCARGEGGGGEDVGHNVVFLRAKIE